MRHSVFAGGKRLRPVLCIEAGRMVAGSLPAGIDELGAALALQLTLGISMVLRGFPLWLATAHTAGAALLLLAALALLRALSAR